MPRFFIEQSPKPGEKIIISGNDYNHLKNSLRLNLGDRVILSDGTGFDFEAELSDYLDSAVELEIIKKEKSAVEAKLQVWLAQGLPKKSKLDLVVEKATEIGFSGLIPLEAERSIVKYDNRKKAKKRQRWQRVAEAAAKQAGRAIIPEIKEVMSPVQLKNLKNEFDYILLLWEDENQFSLKKFFQNYSVTQTAKILLLVGPEGGFSAAEVEQYKKELGALVITLGPRILRTETAGITALTAVLYEKGELGDLND
ncbi:16S rRNA (uracil(1498)-N(3))-methyltransferase [Halanaerobium salsuginis]|jgi:16S rRNA (uracil1498-N3)-methyltransferase|uniref:Ribosomal RNA small subunit methyltransferase E n=1 Tax=Halanaerobium salsuginis TaxID=29563 RepID=A0A1I4G6Q3_9FIRM|nr:16S rRNA (uracil(1498)-N(3))-methyltransferase [Halanaerobium salsuginis]SFL25762.1 16S rRNA (uracil1498-N3)-methyltransferase [Halanaerobium salsuginis]